MNHERNTRRIKAFTLIELLVVIAIISFLSALILNSLASSRMRANDTKISEDLRQFRIAADLYYNDNKTYPPTAMNYKDENIATQNQYQNKKDVWISRLSFFVKTAEAAPTHSITKLCVNFDKVASSLVAKKYLASVPFHPYDNDAKGVCYKAVNAGNTFSAYAPLTTLVNVGSGVSAGVISKRTGFILGDVSTTGITNLITETASSGDSTETPYPIGTDGKTAVDVTESADVIYGIVGGTSGSAGAGGIITNTSSTAPETPSSTLTVNKGYVSPGYTITLTNDNISGSLFVSPQSYSNEETVYVYAAIYNGSSYKPPQWVGCDAVLGLTTCKITMDGDKTVSVSQ